MRTITKATIAVLALTALAAPAIADDVVQVTWRKAQVMSFGSGIAGIVIGDPSVVDVTLDGNGQIIVFGKAPGETNMIITGSDNSVLFNAPIVVMPEDDRQVSIINAGSGTISERSWTCLTRCVQVLGPGGTSYASIQAQGGGTVASPVGAASAGGSNAEATAAAQQTAQGVSNANAATARGASNVAGQGGVMILP
jgi:Flp pilus assembly secretin CpaC